MIEATGFAVELTEAQMMLLYRQMLAGRMLGTHLEAERAETIVYADPMVGGEAPQVAAAMALKDGDVFGGGPQDSTAIISRGRSIADTVADALQPRQPGSVPMGLFQGPVSVPLRPDAVAPAAVGAAMALRLGGSDQVALASGVPADAATGLWHESIECAALLSLPVVFLVQSVRRTDIEHRSVADRAAGYGIPAAVVDASDVLECYDAVRSAVERARDGDGPSLIEAVLVEGPDGEISGDDDCLQRFEEYLGVRGMLDGHRREHLEAQIETEIDEAVAAVRDRGAIPTYRSPFAGKAEISLSTSAPALPAGPELTAAEAIDAAVAFAMERDDRILVVAGDEPDAGLRERFGAERVIGAPFGSALLIGIGSGAALARLRPIVVASGVGCPDSIAELLAAAGAQHEETSVSLPMVIVSDWVPASAPGIRVVIPGTVSDARALVLEAIRDPNPVVVVRSHLGEPAPVPPGDQQIPLGRAQVIREGEAVTIVAWGDGVMAAAEAADMLAAEGAVVEVVDLRSLGPIDWETVDRSLTKTGRLAVVEPGGSDRIGVELAAHAAEEGFWGLDAPVVRISTRAGEDDPREEAAAIAAAVRTLISI